MSSYDFTLKILLLGDASVGKASFTKRFCYNVFNPSERLTIGVDFHVKTIDLHGKKLKLQIWDVGGEERFRFLLPTYCLGANAAFLLYDVTRSQTLDNISEWINIVHQKSGDIPIMLIGSKSHLKDRNREISREHGIKIAKSRGANGFIEVSAKTGENVEKAFKEITRLALDYFRPAIIDEIRLDHMKKSIIRYVNLKSKTNKQITRARTIKAIKKSLKLAEKDQSWDDEIWAFTISLCKSICKRITPKTIYFR